MGWRFAYCIGVTATVCLGGPLAFADSPEPIDLPDPRRMIVTARLVESGEFTVYDPVAIGLGSTRTMPDAVALPGQRRIAVAARMDSIYVALPMRMRTVVSARMDSIDNIAVPDPHGITATARMDSIDIAVPDPFAIGIALRITEAALKMPATRRMRAATWRHAPEIIPIIEPLAMTAVIQRHVYEANVYLQLVQSFLKGRGYDPGPLDGLMGDRTRSAIASFKADMASAGTLSDEDRSLLEWIEGLPK